MFTFVVAKDGTPLMPTSNVKKVRKLLRSGRAVIEKYRPFTIRLMYESTTNTQPVEFTEDTGQHHIGVSLKSEKHEYIHAEFQPLKDETNHHEDARMYRHTRRNRKRYRKCRFQNRRRPKEWIAPTLEHIKDLHIQIYKMYSAVCPISNVLVEVATFDTQLLEAIETGKPVPVGKDYQHGMRYQFDTLRDAIFYRDNYTCKRCGKSSIKDGVMLHVHHVGYWKGDHSDRGENLATVCERCNTPKEHQTGGKLYGWEPKLKSLSGAAFMNTVRKYIYKDLKNTASTDTKVSYTFGTITKHIRHIRRIPKSHSNDAYCIGMFHPKHRSREQVFQKQRRNNRVLEKFYDAKYKDIRDGSVKTSKELSCNRTNRRTPRNNDLNERIYRCNKTSKGRRNIRKQRYSLRPNDVIIYDGQRYLVSGVNNKGMTVILKGTKKCPSVSKVKVIYHTNG